MEYQTLTPEEVLKNYQFNRAIKTTPTKIRPLTESDIQQLGDSFIDLEGIIQKVSLDRCLCVGVEDEQWTISLENLHRYRFAVSEPDADGFREYRMRNYDPIYFTILTFPFKLITTKKTWQSQEDGGVITWNGKDDQELIMRIIKTSIFLKTYAVNQFS